MCVCVCVCVVCVCVCASVWVCVCVFIRAYMCVCVWCVWVWVWVHTCMRVYVKRVENLCSYLVHSHVGRDLVDHSTLLYLLCPSTVSRCKRSVHGRSTTTGSASSLPQCGWHCKGVCICMCTLCVCRGGVGHMHLMRHGTHGT